MGGDLVNRVVDRGERRRQDAPKVSIVKPHNRKVARALESPFAHRFHQAEGEGVVVGEDRRGLLRAKRELRRGRTLPRGRSAAGASSRRGISTSPRALQTREKPAARFLKVAADWGPASCRRPGVRGSRNIRRRGRRQTRRRKAPRETRPPDAPDRKDDRDIPRRLAKGVDVQFGCAKADNGVDPTHPEHLEEAACLLG